MSAAKLESIIGYRFRNIGLLERALTHRSWTHENRRSEPDNELLEFLGDSVLGLTIAERLFTEFPDASEGELTQMKHRLVSMPTLASIASSMGLGDFISLGRGEEASGGREKPAILADALEAVIGAVFIDGGYIEARSFIVRLFRTELKRIAPDRVADHKSRLQELLQANKLSAPEYRLIRSEGPPHDRTFYVEAVWEGGNAEGCGRSLKLAEMDAAELALKILANAPIRAAKP